MPLYGLYTLPGKCPLQGCLPRKLGYCNLVALVVEETWGGVNWNKFSKSLPCTALMEPHLLCELLSVVRNTCMLAFLGKSPPQQVQNSQESRIKLVYTQMWWMAWTQHKSHFKPAVATPVLRQKLEWSSVQSWVRMACFSYSLVSVLCTGWLIRLKTDFTYMAKSVTQ